MIPFQFNDGSDPRRISSLRQHRRGSVVVAYQAAESKKKGRRRKMFEVELKCIKTCLFCSMHQRSQGYVVDIIIIRVFRLIHRPLCFITVSEKLVH